MGIEKFNDFIYVVVKDDIPVIPTKGKKMPKTYTDPKNAHIAIQNMGGYEEGYEIHIYEPVGVVTSIGGKELPKSNSKRYNKGGK